MYRHKLITLYGVIRTKKRQLEKFKPSAYNTRKAVRKIVGCLNFAHNSLGCTDKLKRRNELSVLGFQPLKAEMGTQNCQIMIFGFARKSITQFRLTPIFASFKIS